MPVETMSYELMVEDAEVYIVYKETPLMMLLNSLELKADQTAIAELCSCRYGRHVDFCHKLDGCPIVGGPSFYMRVVSKMVDIILQLNMTFIPHLLRDSFDLLGRISTTTQDYLGSCAVSYSRTGIFLGLRPF